MIGRGQSSRVVAVAAPTFAAVLVADANAVVEPAFALAADGNAVVEPTAALAADGDAVVEPTADLATMAGMQSTAAAREASAAGMHAAVAIEAPVAAIEGTAAAVEAAAAVKATAATIAATASGVCRAGQNHRATQHGGTRGEFPSKLHGCRHSIPCHAYSITFVREEDWPARIREGTVRCRDWETEQARE